MTGIGEKLPKFIIDNINAALAGILDSQLESIIKEKGLGLNDLIDQIWNNTYAIEPYGVSFSYALSKFPVSR